MQSNLRCPHHLLMLFLGASLALLRDGKSHLLTLVLALMIELGQRMSHGLIIVDAVAEGVDGLPDGMSESGGVGLTLARNGILGALTRGRTHQRQSAEVVDAVLRQQRVEGRYALVVIHGVSKAPTKYKIISADESFHGRTFDTLAATGHDYYHVGYGPLSPGHVLVPYGDIKALEAQMDDDVCAVLLEPIQGEGGVHVPPAEYLQQVRALCDKHDALLIFDEVQTGVARTGKWFAYMHSGVKPDILTFAKGIGGGFPVAGFAVPERLAHVFKPGDHGGTFGGNPLACAAVYATLTTIKSEGLVDKVAEKGEYFKNELRTLQEKYPDKVTDVRGCGLMLGMEVAGEGKPIVESCLENHVIVNCTAGNVIRIVPPLIISKEEIDIVVAALDKALAAC